MSTYFLWLHSILLRFSWNSEADTSEFQENRNKVFEDFNGEDSIVYCGDERSHLQRTLGVKSFLCSFETTASETLKLFPK